MKRAGILLLAILWVATLFGCAAGDTSQETVFLYQEPEAPARADGIYDIGYDRLPCSEEELYRQLFDPGSKVILQLQMEESEIAKLQQDYELNAKSPTYRIASLNITLEAQDGSAATYRIHDVGVRMKGNTSRTDFYSPEEGIYNAIHLKLSFQETFDEEALYGSEARTWASSQQRTVRKNRTFATLEKLEMRWNKCYDSTYLKEGYAYQLYRSQGVLAPRTTLCSFDWSGLHMGVYTLAEPVDERFLEKNLPEADLGGDLYKLGWADKGASFTALASIGIENESKNEFYTYDLKTNKKTSHHESLKSLLKALNYSSLTQEDFSQLVDTDYFLSYAAVSYFLGNPDDLRNNYNNCYLYFRKSDGKAIIIPYDYDRCLGITYEWNPSGDGMTTDSPFSDRRQGAEPPAQQENPLFLYTVVPGGYYMEPYAQALTRVAADPLLTPESFQAQFIQAEALYGDDAQPGKEFRNGNGRSWAFSLENPGGENLSFQSYLHAKILTFWDQMAFREDFTGQAPTLPKTHYIRADFLDWEQRDGWAMECKDGVFTYRLTYGWHMRFKVYCATTGIWYGTESLAEASQALCATDIHGNILLKPGTYLVIFDPVAETVTVEKST